jgi:membrane protease YdiL (CAAX protease family)
MEEIAFRSYPFIKLHKRFGLRMTQVIVAVVFALYHVAGGQSVLGSFLGPGVYAFVFGLAAVWSGGIAMPFGIHLALNILQPLTGMRGGVGAVWTLSQKNNVAGSSMAAPETIGMVMQFIVLVAAILLTEYYIRKKGNQRTQNGSAKYNNEQSPDSLDTDFLQKSQPTAHNIDFKK